MELMTAQALADALNLSVETVWRYTRQRRIPFIELGSKQYRYNLEQVVQALSAAEIREKEPAYRIDPDKTYTYQDYLELPEEPGYRYEVLDGELVRDPSPNLPHQRVSRRLQRMLEDYFWQVDPQGEVFNAPLDVTFGERTVVQPDLFYIAGEQRQIMERTRIDGAPALVVEVLSPGNTRKDQIRKLTIYLRAGVRHYWLVDPDAKFLQCFSLREDAYAVTCSGMEAEVVEPPEFTGLKIDLAVLWQGNDNL